MVRYSGEPTVSMALAHTFTDQMLNIQEKQLLFPWMSQIIKMWAKGSMVGNETLRFYTSQMKSLKLMISQKFSSHEKAMSPKIN